MSINEATRGLEWLHSQLSGSPAVVAALPGGLWLGVAPLGTPAPYGMYGHQGGADIGGVAGIRLLSSGVYQVVAYGPLSAYAAVSAAADAIDAAIQRQSGAAGSDATTLACVREQPLALQELVNGVPWARVGGLYRLLVHALV